MSLRDDAEALMRASADPLDAVSRALEAANLRFETAALAALEAEAEQHEAAQELRRLRAAYAALTGEALPEATNDAPEKIAAAPVAPPEPPKPLGGICMACEAPAVFPTTRTMKGVPITIHSCQQCGCDNLL